MFYCIISIKILVYIYILESWCYCMSNDNKNIGNEKDYKIVRYEWNDGVKDYVLVGVKENK